MDWKTHPTTNDFIDTASSIPYIAVYGVISAIREKLWNEIWSYVASFVDACKKDDRVMASHSPQLLNGTAQEP